MRENSTERYSYSEAEAAVRKLKIKSKKSYFLRYHEDAGLPRNPSISYRGKGWVNWYVFLGNADRTAYYSRYEDAKAAAIRLGLKGAADYKIRRREDPKLPAVPSTFYMNKGWEGSWGIFLNIKRYNYDEARASSLSLGIKSMNEYSLRYHEDPLLPAAPQIVFSNKGWSGWCHFTGRSKKELYSYEEAQAVCSRLNIKDVAGYTACCKDDPKLPGSPHHTYAGRGWKDWYCFLGKKRFRWYTFEEAKKTCQEMGIKSNNDYSKRYRENPRLPSAPEKTYKGIGWLGWYDFLGNEKPENFSSDYPRIMADADRWIKTQTSIPIKRAAIKFLLNCYVRGLGLPDDPLYLLSKLNVFEASFYTGLIDELPPSAKQSYHNALASFFTWLLEQYCVDDEGGERVVLPDYRNPLLTVLSEYFDGLEKNRPSQSVKPVLGYEYILRARNYLVPNSESSLLRRPTLKSLPHLQEVFDSKWDWKDVDKSCIDMTDPNCVWRLVTKPGLAAGGAAVRVDQYQVWSPLRFIALYTLLRYPLRGQQILWLDSGEADAELPVLSDNGTISWKTNTECVVSKGRKSRSSQGVIQRGANGVAECYITTNKTGRKVGGYRVDWIPDDLVYWLIVLREWQRKYNPLVKPTAWTEIELPQETNEKILKARGAQCFLFRINSSGQPLSIKNCFALTLPAVLYRIQRDSEDLASKGEWRAQYNSKYTPHSLRVSLITAFIADGDAPLHIISKLVGHANLVMTIYYTKLNSEQIRRPMGEIEKLAGQRAAERTLESIRLNGLSAVKGQLIATVGNRALLESNVPKTACVVFDFGICPMSAAGCHIGGDIIIKRQKEEFYNPVEGGYLGQKNCARCRFFITGVPFLGGLVALANEISLEINSESMRYLKYTDELTLLEQRYYDACRAGIPFQDETQRKKAVGNQESSAGKLEVLLRDYASLNAHIQSCIKLVNQEGQGGTEGIRLVSAGEIREVGVAFNDSDSPYHLLAELCQNAVIYKSANPSRAIPLIAQAIDRMAENNGLPARMFKLTDEQTLVVANELTNLLIQRLGSWSRIDDLFTGNLMLLDVGVEEPSLECITAEVRQVLSRTSNSAGATIAQKAGSNG